MTYDTANGPVTLKHGVRVRVGWWDKISDAVINGSQGTPNLIAMGERVHMSGFNFIWLTGKCPTFISWGGRYIIILAEKDLVPFWSPDLERSKDVYGT